MFRLSAQRRKAACAPRPARPSEDEAPDGAGAARRGAGASAAVPGPAAKAVAAASRAPCRGDCGAASAKGQRRHRTRQAVGTGGEPTLARFDTDTSCS